MNPTTSSWYKSQLNHGFESVMARPSCDRCKKTFKNNFELIQHEKKKCKNKTCEKCGTTFARPQYLKKHQELFFQVFL